MTRSQKWPTPKYDNGAIVEYHRHNSIRVAEVSFIKVVKADFQREPLIIYHVFRDGMKRGEWIGQDSIIGEVE